MRIKCHHCRKMFEGTPTQAKDVQMGCLVYCSPDCDRADTADLCDAQIPDFRLMDVAVADARDDYESY